MKRIDLDHRQLDSFAFALIDPLRGDDSAHAAWAEFSLHELAPASFAAQAVQLPKLVDLSKIHGDTHDKLHHLLLSQSPPIGASLCVALLKTMADAERMVMHFRHVLAPRFPQGQRGLFLAHDPAVFEQLAWMLPNKAMSALLGPVSAWAMPLRGAWYMHESAPESAVRTLHFHLDAATWQRVQRIGAIHAVLNAESMWRSAPAEWGSRAEKLLIRAEQYQLVDRDDAVAFASHGLRWHAAIDKHPRVEALLQSCIGHPARYQRLANLWTDADWQAIAEALGAPTSTHAMPDSANLMSQGACQ
ncbi:hypothetical protein [Rhodanobacter glycinis]|uniref:DUF4123 domain-containing protein n=1 Tax=Rhodanobacter glycinis TaxID=582702 RepID=A0A1I4GKL0_9GAMM|nr:hypothetical protein [Rhodanobacter glycinis]SFL29646.1 protein of unknown function [Rhodanobacter glycinis]HWU77202.1 hypothetical protein [Rhodanobacter sp.]